MPMNFERSVLTETAISLLRGINDEITYQELAKRAKTTVEEIKGVLPSALRILSREGIEFGRITGVGVRRMNELDKAHKTEANKKKIARAAGRAEKHAARIDLEKLPQSERNMVTINRTVFRMARRAALTKPEDDQTPPAQPPQTSTEKIVRLRRGTASP